MYSRSERFPESVKNEIGPATYVISDRPLVKEAWPPFYSGTTRGGKLEKTNLSAASYYPKYRKHKIQGGGSLCYTAPRTYCVPPLGASPSAFDPSFTSPTPKKETYFAKVYHQDNPLLEKYYPPSVPQCNSRGYKFKNGEIIVPNQLQVPELIDVPLISFPGNCLKLKVRGWSANTRPRETTVIVDEQMPGPGYYELRERPPTEFEKYMESFREIRRNKPYAKRYPDDIIAQELLKNFPGPNVYDVNYDILQKPTTFSNKGTFPQSKRETFPVSHYPAPGDYGVPEIKCRQMIVRCAPFLCRKSRFKNEKIDCTPGPPSYNPLQGTISFELNKKLPSMYAKQTVFGSCKLYEPREKTVLPGPGHYDIKDKPSKREIFHFEDMKAPVSDRFPRQHVQYV